METNQKLKTNLDTNLLKLIAIIAMVIDHVGAAIFPQQPLFRIVGRIVFPIFCYCMSVGLLYTKDIKKYLTRLGLFALISQPFWVLAFNADDFWGNLFNFNIFFTLFITMLTVWAFKEKNWILFILGFVVTAVFNFDYSTTGIFLMLIFLFCRNNPPLGIALFTLFYIPSLFTTQPGSFFALTIGNIAIGYNFFSIFAIPLIFINTNSNIKISKWFFYAFYPAHLLVIYLVKCLM